MLDAPKVLDLLNRNQIEFVLVGGLAMITHGSAHITDDLDVCYHRSEANIARIAMTIASICPTLRGAPAGLPFRFDAPTIKAGLNFTLSTDLGPVDFLGEVAGLGDYAQAFSHSQVETIFGMPVRVLSLDALIATKKAARRAKDMTHLLELEELKKLRDSMEEAGP